MFSHYELEENLIMNFKDVSWAKVSDNSICKIEVF